MANTWAYWIVAGILLMLAELAIGAFFIFWFGLGALVVGLLLWLFPGLDFIAQFLLWAVASLVFVALWFRLVKPNLKSKLGQSHEAVIGEVGLVIRDIKAFQKGQVQFQKPLMGDDKWEAIADTDIASGERVEITAVQGNIIKVKTVAARNSA